MNIDEIKQYNRVAKALNKISIETMGLNHPSDEDIYLYNLKMLAPEIMDKMTTHIENCIKCSDILDQVIQFQELEEEIEIEILESMQNVATPSLKPSDESIFQPVSDWLKTHIKKIAISYGTLNLKTVSAGAAPKIEKLKTQIFPYGKTTEECTVFAQYGTNEIEFYTKKDSLIGKKIIFKDMKNKIVECRFEGDDVSKDYKAVAYFEIPQDITLEQIESLTGEIID